MTDISRRSLLRTAAAAPLAATAVGCARRISQARSVPAGAPIDGDLTVPLSAAPELGRAGGAVTVRPSGAAGAFLVVNSGSGFLALRGECTHESCEVTWVPEDREAECPCHGSRFAGDGTVQNPPARVDLQSFPASSDGQSVVIHLFAGDGTFKERVVNNQVSFPIAEFPALATVGGAVLGRPDGFPSPLLVTRLSAGTGPDAVGAISAICSHLGCTVLPSGARLVCPCHGSAFDQAGKFLSGPAGTNLLRYAAAFDGTTVTISTTPR